MAAVDHNNADLVLSDEELIIHKLAEWAEREPFSLDFRQELHEQWRNFSSVICLEIVSFLTERTCSIACAHEDEGLSYGQIRLMIDSPIEETIIRQLKHSDFPPDLCAKLLQHKHASWHPPINIYSWSTRYFCVTHFSCDDEWSLSNLYTVSTFVFNFESEKWIDMPEIMMFSKTNTPKSPCGVICANKLFIFINAGVEPSESLPFMQCLNLKTREWEACNETVQEYFIHIHRCKEFHGVAVDNKRIACFFDIEKNHNHVQHNARKQFGFIYDCVNHETRLLESKPQFRLLCGVLYSPEMNVVLFVYKQTYRGVITFEALDIDEDFLLSGTSTATMSSGSLIEDAAKIVAIARRDERVVVLVQGTGIGSDLVKVFCCRVQEAIASCRDERERVDWQPLGFIAGAINSAFWCFV